MNDDLKTRRSLLARLGSKSQNADWEQFYDQYWAIILFFAQKQGLDEASARDVLQETMILLMRKLPGFVYDPDRGRFRNWLLTLVAGKARDAMRRAARSRTISIHEPSSEDRPALEETLTSDSTWASDALEQSWMQALAEEALRRMQSDLSTRPETYAIFRSYAIDGKPVKEVAAEFGVQENAVYQIKNRLIKRLRDIVAELQAAVCATGIQPPSAQGWYE